MSQTLLYHALGIKGVSYRSTQVLGNALVFSVETTNRHVACQSCGHRYCQFKGQTVRWFRMAQVDRKQALLQVICTDCNAHDVDASGSTVYHLSKEMLATQGRLPSPFSICCNSALSGQWPSTSA